ncbi:GNAT family N-acetyltransferase [Microbulbifer variabilis]|uniref:GNAT family N-acetyltransferase n=1 Tax=Microbulbifer variabilis TaxID=266805 RepID=A0ABY4VAX9_9GAMM|nr:GNAT family N-acetyltransferase [Microbulbifer variabilis]USD20333.1 GNAT family N-acetyltransferase [Microbulbifer variabilis]
MRKAIRDNADAFFMLWQFYQYYQSSFNLEVVDSRGRYDIDEEHLSDLIAGNEKCDAYIILVEGGIAGFLTMEQAEIIGVEMPKLSDMFIIPKYRCQGVGSKIVRVLCLRKPVSGMWSSL